MPKGKKSLVIWLMLVLLITTMSFVSGCGGNKPSGQATGSKGQVTLEYWDPDTREAWVKIRDKIIKDYEEQHPNIKIKVVNVPFDQYDTKVQAAFATKTLPDLLYTFRSYASDWGYQGVTQPVTDLIKKIGEDNFNKSQLMYVTVKNDYYAIPYIVYPHVLFYRKDWYAEKGLNPPKTWEELLNNAKVLNQDTNGDGKIDRYGFLVYNKHPDPLVLLDLMATNNAYTFDKDGNVAINSPETIEALNYLKKLAELSPPGSMGKSQQDQRLAFLDGLGAHMVTSVSLADILANKPEMTNKVGPESVIITTG